MAIARVLAVKRFRKHLVRLQHSEVKLWSDKQLKNALFKNGPSWLELLRWLLGELDEEIKECLFNCSDEERVSRIKESILVLGLSSSDNVDKCVKGRVIFKEREELLTQLFELVRMKKVIDAGGTACCTENGVLLEEFINAKDPKNLDRTNISESESQDKTEMLSSQELFELLVSQHPEYQRFAESAEQEALSTEENKESTSEMGSLKPASPCHFGHGHKKDSGVESPSNERLMDDNRKDNASSNVIEEDSNVKPKIIDISDIAEKEAMCSSKGCKAKFAAQSVESIELSEGSSKEESTSTEQSTSQAWAGDTTDECCSAVSPSTLLTKVFSEPKPTTAMNYLEAVHELVNDIERTCQLAK